MLLQKKTIAILILFCSLCALQPSYGQIRLPQLVRDSMILQRDMDIKIWGWATKGEKVTVRFNGKSAKAITGADGKWSVSLPPMKAGGPYTMEISGKNKIELKEVLIGDVWF